MRTISDGLRCGLAAAAALAFLPLAADYVTNTWTNVTAGAEVGRTPATAFDWTDAANWSLGRAPAAGEGAMFNQFSPAGARYVRLPGDVTVGDLNLKSENTVCLIGERVTSTSALRGQKVVLYNGWVFADVTLQAADGEIAPWLGNIAICGRLISPYGRIIQASNFVRHRLDRYATSTDPLRTDDLQLAASGWKAGLHPGNASYAVYAEGADASSSAWTQTAGSPYISLKDASAALVAVGAAVTGAGIPEGTWVRRRFTERTEIELSQPVTETIASNVLSFAAFTPDARLYAPGYWRQGDHASVLQLCKRRDADGLQFEIGEFVNATSAKDQTYWVLGVGKDEAQHWKPGTLVLHAVTGGHKVRPSDVLRNCHLLLAGTAAGGNTVFGETRIMAFEAADYTARLTVTNGVGEVANFTNFVGRLVKDGAGTLRIGLADAVNAGEVAVEAGTLELTARDTAGTDGVSFAALELAAGATLRLPEGGMRVAAATLAEGATVRGPGVLRVAKGDPARVTCLDGAQVVFEMAAAEGAYVHWPEAQAAGHPAFWVDVSKADSLVCEEEDGVKYVTRWNDWRAGEPMFCTNVVRRPRLVTDETGAAKYVKFSYVATTLYTNAEGLVWSQPIDGIRAVFLVQDPSDGGGEILGRTPRVPTGWFGSQGGPYYRGATGVDWSKALICPNFSTDCVKFGRFFLDGEEVTGYEQGYLGPFLQLVEHHVNTNYAANPGHRTLCCDAFGTGGYLDGHEFNSANGRQRIAECLVYTNTLTHAERVQTALYLSRKWLGKDVAYSDFDETAFVEAVSLGAGGVVETPAGRAAGVRRVEDGSALEKAGEGLLVVESLAAGDVTVRSGELRVKSLSLASASVPNGAWVHVDAADAATLDVAADGTVSEWRSAGDDGHAYRPLVGKPTRRVDALNGLPVVDCGKMNGADKASLLLHRADGSAYTHSNEGSENFIADAPYFRSAFLVYGSQGGGNSLLGCYGNGYPYQGLAHRPDDAGLGLPLFTVYAGPKKYEAWYDNARKAISNGTWAVRLNGARVDPFTTPFSGGYDLLTVSGDFRRKSDTLATYGQGNECVGGLSYGEVLIYSNQLAAAALPKVEAYLRKKWFDVDTSGLRRATCAALRVAAGAVVTVGDWAVARGADAYETGAGALTAGLLGGGGIVCGAVTLAEGGTFEAVAADGALPTLTVEGSLALPAAATLRVAGDAAGLPVGRHVLAACAGLEARDLAWTVEAPAKPRRTYAVRCEKGALVVSVSNAATVLLLR